MNETKDLNEIQLIINSYKSMIFYFEKILKSYYTEDKIYLVYEIKKLKKKLIKLESIIVKLKKINMEAIINFKKYYEKYFQEFQMEFLDLLIFLKWNNFGALRMKLQAMCKEKSPISSVDRANYRVILNILINEI